MKSRLTAYLIIAVSLALFCSGCGEKKQNEYNPAADRIGSMANLPPETEIPSGGITPNLFPIIDAATLAAANTEAVTVKTAARVFAIDHPSSTIITSDDLSAVYDSGTTKARYYLNPTTGLITRVDTTDGVWKGIVFSLSGQKWLEGSPDNNHLDDRDIP